MHLFAESHPMPSNLVRSLLSFATALFIAGAATLAFDANAAREFPQNSRQVKITAVADDAIVADGNTLHLAPGVLIFTTTGTTVVRSALTPTVIARVQLDLNGDVRRIWVLADDEILHWPWWQFWHFRQPQADPTTPVLTN
jgi:hypothetical protein